MNYMKNSEIKAVSLIFLISYLTILIGIFFNEDSLGGARIDYLYHLNIADNFRFNFFETWKGFGYGDTGLQTRNSPIFWVIISFLNKFVSIDTIRSLNSIVSILISFIFFKCVCLKFKDVSKIKLAFLVCSIIFLSPTIRSLSIWPYSLVWGIFFFILSIYNLLLFLERKTKSKKNISTFLSIFYLAISSYFYPSFAFFIFFLLFKFYENSKFFFGILLFNFILSLPALFFILWKGFYFFGAQGVDNLSKTTSFNFSSKIIIITSLILYFLIPVLDFEETIKKIKNQFNIKVFFLIIFISLCLPFFFDYPFFSTGGFGGGFFHKLSNVIFNNNFLLFFIFFMSLIIFVSIFRISLNNIIIYITLILFNLQFTIYNKYYDPIILFILILLTDFKIEKHLFKNKFQIIKLTTILSIYLFMGIFKNNLYNIFL
jgi:hypothetical protein